MHFSHIPDLGYSQYNAVVTSTYQNAFPRHIETETGRNMEQLQKQQKRQFTGYDSGQNSCRQRCRACDKRFSQKHLADMAFFHPQNIIKSKFRLSSLHNKTVTVQKKYQGKHTHYAKTDGKQRTHRASTPDIRRIWTCQQKQHNIKKCDTSCSGKHIGDICFTVIFYVQI